MSTVGLAAIAALVTAGLAVIALRARRRRAAAARPPGPRTVAELVQMRAAAAARSSSSAQPDSVAPEPGRAVRTATALRSDPAADVGPAAEPETATEPHAAEGTEPATGTARRATAPPADEPPIRHDPDRTVPSGVNGSADLPWNRARRLITATDEPAPTASNERTDAPAVLPATSPVELSAPDSPRPTDGAEPQPASATSDPVGRPAADLVGTAGPPPAPARRAADPAEERAPAVEASDGGRPASARSLRLVPPLRPAAADIPAQRIPVADADLAVLGRLGLLDPAAEPEPVLDTSGVDSRMSGVDDQPGPTQRVRFRVARGDGSMVSGAGVVLLDSSGREVANGYADTQGRGELCAPHPGSYLLLAAAPGHQPGAATTASIVDGVAEVPVLLSRSAALVGSVRGPQGPVVAARVTLVQSGEVVDATRSDSIGGYRLTDLAAGGYGLSVTAPGCVPIALQIDVSDGADLHRDIELSRDGQAVPAVRPEPVAEPARQAAGHR